MVKITVAVAVVYSSVKIGNRVKWNTFATIMADGTDYATRHLSGKWSQNEAMKEFRRFPEKFLPTSDYTVAFLKGLAKVA